MKRIVLLTVFLMNLMSITVFGNDIKWDELRGNWDESICLTQGEMTSKDEVYGYARGDIFSYGILDITNMENGEIYVRISTYAHREVDAIYQSVYLDQWDEIEEDWVRMDGWDFSRTKEEAGGNLAHWTVSFTLTGYEVDRYYRLRGLHGVELDGVVEAKSTRTEGVLITDEPV